MHRSVTIGLAIAALAAPALAQSPPETKSPPQKQVHDPSACADTRSTDGTNADRDVRKEQDRRPLSDKLADSKGVICPPHEVDPDINRPAPGGGRTPVIPPPGSPGGDQNVQPK